MASPMYLHTSPAPAPYTYGLDPAVYLVLLAVERREDEALTPADVATIRAALGAYVPPQGPRALATSVPSPDPGEVAMVGVELSDTFGLDPARFRVSISVQRQEDELLSANDLATIKAALAPQAQAAE